MTDSQYVHSEIAGESPQPTMDIWRKEVHSRVARFRSRRGRRIEGAFSMRFPFPEAQPFPADAPSSDGSLQACDISVAEATDVTEPAPISEIPADPSQLATEPIVSAADASGVAQGRTAVAAEMSAEAAVPHDLSETEHGPRAVSLPRPRPKRKVIAFPRRPEGAETGHRLADPVLPEQPRILDVPEELEAYPTTPFLDGLQLESASPTPAVTGEHIELPTRAVGIAHRIWAALVDCMLVAVATTLLALISHKMLPDLAMNKPVRLAAALTPVLLWAIYQYLLLVYGGRTAGMQAAGIRLSTFKGRQPSLHHRRNRVLGLYLSTASLIMGILWALVDVDALCWHDRISGTYLTKRQ